MLKTDKDAYGVVIIGAGISGLVCGCYLAKAGMKVLIAEQHFKPGGYCTSFKRQGFIFDAAAHSFGSYQDGRIVNNVLKDLDIYKRLKIRRYEPSDIIISPDYKISFWSDVNRTAHELQEAFPQEAGGINKFFQFLLNSKPFDFPALKNKTYKDLLSKYFIDERLQSILSVPILGVSGLPSSSISAFSAAVLFKEFLLDGGYYPEGGMQALPDALAKRFKEFGGELRLSRLVKKIRVKSNSIEGVILEKQGFIPSKHVISCCDARQTFLKLLGRRVIDKDFLNKLEKMTPSASVFIAYLGIDNYYKELSTPGVSFWIMPHYTVEGLSLFHMKKRKINNTAGFMIHVPPDKKSIMAFMFAPFKNKQYWINNKNDLLENFVKRVETVFPGISEHIIYKDAATPHTLFRYTLNYKGAAFGWASIPSQLLTDGLAQTTSIEGLYLSGHWTTQMQGIGGVAYIGRETAKLALKNEKKA